MNSLSLPPIFEWARICPVVVLQGDVWVGTSRPPDTTTWIERRGERRGLVRTQSLAAARAEWALHGRSAMEAWITQRLQEAGETVSPLREIREAIRQFKALIFAAGDLVAHIRHVMELPAEEPAFDLPAATAQGRRLDQALHEVETSAPELAPAWATLPEGEWALAEKTLFYLKGGNARAAKGDRVRVGQHLYELAPSPEGREELTDRFRVAVASLLEQHGRQTLPQRRRLAAEQAEANALSQRMVKSLPVSRDGRRLLLDTPRWTVYHAGGSWLVGLRVGPWVMQESDGTLYEFPGTLVSVDADPDPHGRRARVAYPVLGHPFLSDGERSLCMGSYSERGMRGATPAARLLQFLHDARQTLVAGYHARNSLAPYHRLAEFPENRISRAEAERRGLPIYPYHRR